MDNNHHNHQSPLVVECSTTATSTSSNSITTSNSSSITTPTTTTTAISAIIPTTAPRPHYLSIAQRLSYSVGHVFNDLCASFWFTYLLMFMHYVNGFTTQYSGTLLLVGQVADGIATPLIGIECDKNLGWRMCVGYGQRKTWHLVGTLCVLLSFPFIFHLCVYCENSPLPSQMVYYTAFIIIFQFGWAAVQISHLSLIPDLTPLSSERVELNAYRYACTVLANITVFSMVWIVLGQNDTSDDFNVTKQDAITFEEVAYGIVGIGLLFSLIFHMGVREVNRPKPLEDVEFADEEEEEVMDDSIMTHQPSRISCNNTTTSKTNLVEIVDDYYDDEGEEEEEVVVVQRRKTARPSRDTINTSSSSQQTSSLVWKNWFCESQFYKVALLYMGTRLTINLTSVFVPNYLETSLQLQKKSLAYIPLVIYTSGFVSSFVMKYVNGKLGKRLTYLVGACISLIAFVWIYFGTTESYKTYGIFGVSILIGISSTTILITSLAITNDLIGQHTTTSAFVFGAMSFVDKISNGVAVFVIQCIAPNYPVNKTCTGPSCDYYRYVLTFVCGGATTISLIALALLSTGRKIGHLNNVIHNSNNSSNSSNIRRNSSNTRNAIYRPMDAIDCITVDDINNATNDDDYYEDDEDDDNNDNVHSKQINISSPLLANYHNHDD